MIDLNVINTYMILSTFVYNSYAMQDLNEGLLNVGTVLFTPTDLNTKRWDKTNIELLEARRYFQNIIPSPRSTETLSENYINNMLKYFSDAFGTIGSLATDPEMSNVMETALSDVVGGFFKVWVLPVTKYAYYGGLITEDNAVEAFKFYDKLKNSLNSDGNGWQSPTDEILNFIAISVIPFSYMPHARSVKNACEHLAYYEKYNDSLSIATPFINWENIPSSMFLPLKNESLVILTAPSSSKALLKYYDIAKSCCSTSSPDGCKEFDRRFQNWLSDDVVPHLKDDNLYIAFDSVLTLLNKTKELFDSYVGGITNFPPCMTSKTFLILIVVLFLEILWCVPTVLYIICARKKNKGRSRTQFFLDTFKRRRSGQYKCEIGRFDQNEPSYISKNEPKSVIRISRPRKMENGVKLFQKPRARNIEIVTQYPSRTSKHSTGQVTEYFPDIINISNQSAMVINELPIKSSLKRKSLNITDSSLVQTTNSLIATNCNSTMQTESFVTVQKLETTITKIVQDKIDCNSKSCTKTASSHNTVDKIHSKGRQKVQEPDKKDEFDDICPCICCIEDDKKNAKELSETNKIIEIRPSETKETYRTVEESSLMKKAPDSGKTKLPKLKNKYYVQKDIKLNKSKGLRLNTGEPLLEIRIDRPPAEITLDITKRSGSSKKNTKPSKIPRRTAFTTKEETTQNVLNETKNNQYIPNVSTCSQTHQLPVKKRSADDIDVRKKTSKCKKMNVTL